MKSLPSSVTESFKLDNQMKRYYINLFNDSPKRLSPRQMRDTITIDLLLKLKAVEDQPYLDEDDLFDIEPLTN